MTNHRAASFKLLLVGYVVCLPLLALLDAVWLGLVAADFYQAQIGHLMAPSPRLAAALAFYLVYPAAIVLFAIKPALETGSAAKAWRLGAAFGFFAYATYDLTNLATLRDWPLLVSLVDVAWGTTISGGLALLGFRAAQAAEQRWR